jgi:signal transduction histidine kinase
MAQRIRVTGEVKSVSAEMVVLTPTRDSGVSVPMMMIDSVQQFGGFPLDAIVEEGDLLEGDYDSSTNRFFPDFGHPTEASFLAEHLDGQVVLAYVARSKASEGTFYVHPELPVIVKRADLSTSDSDHVNTMYDVGDIAALRVGRNAKSGIRLTGLDVDDDDPIAEAPTLVAARGPWLTQSKMNVIEQLKAELARQHDEQEAISTALDVLSRQMDLDVAELEQMLGNHADTGQLTVQPETTAVPVSGRERANAQFAESQFRKMIANYQVEIRNLATANRELSESLRAASAKEVSAREHAESLKAQLSKARQELQEALKQARGESGESTITDRRARFATAEEWIVEEVRRFWLAAYKPADRVRFPLDRQPWRVLSSFAETFTALDDDAKLKALKTITYIVTGRNALEHIIEDHALREGDESSRPEVVRETDGAACRRAYLESHTAQARRLHYWKLRDGSIELSRVGLHDDYTP